MGIALDAGIAKSHKTGSNSPGTMVRWGKQTCKRINTMKVKGAGLHFCTEQSPEDINERCSTWDRQKVGKEYGVDFSSIPPQFFWASIAFFSYGQWTNSFLRQELLEHRAQVCNSQGSTLFAFAPISGSLAYLALGCWPLLFLFSGRFFSFPCKVGSFLAFLCLLKFLLRDVYLITLFKQGLLVWALCISWAALAFNTYLICLFTCHHLSL